MLVSADHTHPLYDVKPLVRQCRPPAELFTFAVGYETSHLTIKLPSSLCILTVPDGLLSRAFPVSVYQAF